MFRNRRMQVRAKCIATMRRRLKDLIPRQRPLTFTGLQEEMDDEVYQTHFSKLFLDISEFVQDRFGRATVDYTDPLWSLDHSDEFLKHAQKIAKPGPDGNWERILRNTGHRCALVQGIIAMILDKCVFSSLLLGASPEHMRILSTEDVSMINLEGFKRTSLRADTNKAFLQANGNIPPFFWHEVDRIATQIMHLLILMYIDITEEEAAERWHPFPMHQAIHDIVAFAGWLSVAIRLSHKITTIEWICPGQAYEHEFISIGADRSTKSALNDHIRLGVPGRTRVLICLVPKITRHIREDDSHFRGKQTYDVTHAHVVTYYGIWPDWEDQYSVSPLPLHISNRRPPHWIHQWNETLQMSSVILINLSFLVILFFFLYALEEKAKRGKLKDLVPSSVIRALNRTYIHNLFEQILYICLITWNAFMKYYPSSLMRQTRSCFQWSNFCYTSSVLKFFGIHG